MHVHRPKPLHAWREFVGEVATVAFKVVKYTSRQFSSAVLTMRKIIEAWKLRDREDEDWSGDWLWLPCYY